MGSRMMQAFAAALHDVLHQQTAALNHLQAAVQHRRKAESAGLQKNPSMGIAPESTPAMTVMEVVLHTQQLQVRDFDFDLQCQAPHFLCLVRVSATAIERKLRTCCALKALIVHGQVTLTFV